MQGGAAGWHGFTYRVVRKFFFFFFLIIGEKEQEKKSNVVNEPSMAIIWVYL